MYTSTIEVPEGTALAASATMVSDYMFVARYNRSKWNALSWEQKKQVHQAAEEWFPEGPEEEGDPDESQPRRRPGRKGPGQAHAPNLCLEPVPPTEDRRIPRPARVRKEPWP